MLEGRDRGLGDKSFGLRYWAGDDTSINQGREYRRRWFSPLSLFVRKASDGKL